MKKQTRLQRNVREQLKFRSKRLTRPMSRAEVKQFCKVIAKWLEERRNVQR